jgi:hypothetical protein
MADILNLQVKDDTLNNIISNNPFYIDIKGSVNICLIRCGQEIESCNSVNFSTMTNYGKILVLNPDKSKQTKCNIKLAFDSNNDSTNNDGNANYKFEKAFFTVPSLHKLNGQIFDMETFLLFSSPQKNGSILYVCLCVFNTGTNVVKDGDPKLLNFKLLNELFSKNNNVPDMYGTNPINGIPNPVDLSNFIPEEGSRNFYDYTHPSNTKVNFRIFQTPMYISNDILLILKNKLTPGNIYTNFKDYINKSINPTEGLFFYFSEDLTNRYKSFQANNTNNDSAKQKDTFENISEKILEEQELHEKNEEFKKLEIKKNKIVEENEDGIDTDEVDTKKVEEFTDDEVNESNKSITILMIIISFIFLMMILTTIFINNFFTSNDNIPINKLPECIKELTGNKNMIKIMSIKFKFILVLIWHLIITIITLIILGIYMSNNDSEQEIYKSVLTFLGLINFNVTMIIILYVFYFMRRFFNIYDDDFSQKEHYLFKYILEKINFDSTIFGNLKKIIWDGDFSSFSNHVLSGGGDEKNNDKYKNYEDVLKESILHIPDETKFFKEKEEFNKVNYNITKLFDSKLMAIIHEKFDKNKSWRHNSYILLIMIIIFLIIGFIFQVKYLSTANDIFLKIIVSNILTISTYTPIILSMISIGYYYGINNIAQIILCATTMISLFVGLFIPLATNNENNFLKNIPFWISFSFFAISLLTLITGMITRKEIITSGIGLGSGYDIYEDNGNKKDYTDDYIDEYDISSDSSVTGGSISSSGPISSSNGKIFMTPKSPISAIFPNPLSSTALPLTSATSAVASTLGSIPLGTTTVDKRVFNREKEKSLLLSQELQSKIDEINELERKISLYESKNSSSPSHNLEDKILLLEQQLRNKNNEIHNIRTRYTPISSSISSPNQRLKNALRTEEEKSLLLSKELESKIDEVNELERKISLYESKNSSSPSHNLELRKELKNERDKILLLEKQLQNKNNEISKIKHSSTSSPDKGLKNPLNSEEEKTLLLSQELQSKIDEVNELERKISLYESKISSSPSNNLELRKELSNERDKILLLEKQLQNKNNEISKIKMKHSSTSSYDKGLKNPLNSEEEKSLLLSQELQSKIDEVNELERKISLYESKISSSPSNNLELRKELSNERDKILLLEKQLENKYESISSYNKELKNEKEKSLLLSQELESKIDNVNELEKRISLYESKISSSPSHNLELRKELNNEKDKISLFEKQLTKLKEKLSEKNVQLLELINSTHKKDDKINMLYKNIDNIIKIMEKRFLNIKKNSEESFKLIENLVKILEHLSNLKNNIRSIHTKKHTSRIYDVLRNFSHKDASEILKQIISNISSNNTIEKKIKDEILELSQIILKIIDRLKEYFEKL